jgi:hypothetical protein
VLEQRKTILKVLLNCVSSQKNKFMVLDKRKYRIGIFTELCLTRAPELVVQKSVPELLPTARSLPCASLFGTCLAGVHA